ncbi:class I SAM-dependent methyltransferase [Mesobacterium pallidum]|uniref:methyltransferase domain-containing protein n=1 Tax=Mesobacterium pallidum TaxID=2872037 RepID=UPI001EE2F57B|nr:class I SAM-dependent methyltransferase [Mesobacterium pallidum]
MSSHRDTLAVYDRDADRYARMVAKENAQGMDIFLSALAPGSRVLDLGCGPGHHAAAMAAAGMRVLAVDGSAAMVAMTGRHPGVEARQVLFDDIATLPAVDGIWASFSLLHAPRADLPRHLAALRGLVQPGAPLFLGMKLGEGERVDHLGRFTAYFSEAELRAELALAGFTVTQATPGRGKGLAGTVDDWLLLHAHA